MTDQDQLHTVEWVPERAYRKEDQTRLWFHDSLHNNPPSSPMGASVYHWPRGTQVASEWFSFPYSRGFDYVLYDGRIYPGVTPITDPEEIKAREPIFGEKLKKALDSWPEFYADGVKEWTSMLSYLRGMDKRTLPLDRLLIVLKDAVKISKRSWELHFIYMYPSIFAYMTFEAICKEYNIAEKEMRVFLQGFETKMFELDRAMWRLADIAKEMIEQGQANGSFNPELNKFLARRMVFGTLDEIVISWVYRPNRSLSELVPQVYKMLLNGLTG